MYEHRQSRRAFLKQAAAGAAGLSLAGCGLFRGGTAPAVEATVIPVAPSDRIVLGMIGVGSMGTNRLREFLGQADVEIGAICDVDANHREAASRIVRDARGSQIPVFNDYRRLLELPDIDAVAVVTPDHWHSIPFVHACEAGKDVFVEKPLSYSVAEGRAMVDAARRHGRVSQMGNHIHNDLPNYRRVVERIKSGQLGRVTHVQLWKTSNIEGRGHPPDSDPPPGLDYDFWLGPAPKRPYNPLRSHGTFRHFWDYSGGTFIDFWCHIADIAFWALDLPAPLRVSATGGRFFLTDATETPDTLHATFEFPEVLMSFLLHPKPPAGLEHMGGIGAVFVGEDATLVTNYSDHQVYVDGRRIEDFPAPSMHIPDSPGHLREFIDAVKTRELETTCNVEYGHRLSKVGLLANIAYRTGSTLQWDDARETIPNNPEARSLLAREGREPWAI